MIVWLFLLLLHHSVFAATSMERFDAVTVSKVVWPTLIQWSAAAPQGMAEFSHTACAQKCLGNSPTCSVFFVDGAVCYMGRRGAAPEEVLFASPGSEDKTLYVGKGHLEIAKAKGDFFSENSTNDIWTKWVYKTVKLRSHSCFFHCAELETDCHVVVEDGDQCHFGSYLNNDQPYPNPNVILKEKNWIVNYKSGLKDIIWARTRIVIHRYLSLGLTFTALGGIKNTDSCMGKCLLRAPHNGVHECKLVVFIKMVCYMGNFKGNNVMDVAGPPWIKDIYGLVWMYMDPEVSDPIVDKFYVDQGVVSWSEWHKHIYRDWAVGYIQDETDRVSSCRAACHFDDYPCEYFVFDATTSKCLLGNRNEDPDSLLAEMPQTDNNVYEAKGELLVVLPDAGTTSLEMFPLTADTTALPSCFQPAEFPHKLSKYAAATVERDQILVCGGEKTDGLAQKSCYRYDAHTNSWAIGGDMSVARKSVGFAHLPKYYGTYGLLMSGGIDDSGNTLYSIEYTFDGTTFYGFKGNLSEPRSGHCLAISNLEDVIVVGGRDATGSLLKTAYRISMYYNTYTFEDLADMPDAAEFVHGCQVVKVLGKQKIVVAAQYPGTESDAVIVYDLTTNAWSPSTFVGGASYGAATVRLGPTMIRTGGSGALAKKVYKYNEVANTWGELGFSLQENRFMHGSVVIYGNGKLPQC